MKHYDFLKLLVKTGTGNIDLMKIGCTQNDIKAWKKGKKAIPDFVSQYLLERVND